MVIRMALKRDSIFFLRHVHIYLFFLILYEKGQLLKDKRHIIGKENNCINLQIYTSYSMIFVHV